MHKARLLFAASFLLFFWPASADHEREWVSSIAWSPDGQTIAAGGSAGVWLFDNDFNILGHIKAQHRNSHQPQLVAWNSTSDLLAYSSFFSSIFVIDAKALEIVREIQVPYPGLWAPVQWHPYKNQIIGGTYQGTTHIWDAISGEELFYFESPPTDPNLGYEPLGFCWFADSHVVVVSSPSAYLVDRYEGRILQTFPSFHWKEWISCNRQYQVLTMDGLLRDLLNHRLIRVFGPGVDEPYSNGFRPLAVAWSPSANQFVSSKNRCRIRVYEFSEHSARLSAELSGGSYYHRSIGSRIGSIAWRPDGSRFAVAGEFDEIRVWDAETYELLQRFHGFDPHRDLLATIERYALTDKTLCP